MRNKPSAKVQLFLYIAKFFQKTLLNTDYCYNTPHLFCVIINTI